MDMNVVVDVYMYMYIVASMTVLAPTCNQGAIQVFNTHHIHTIVCYTI